MTEGVTGRGPLRAGTAVTTITMAAIPHMVNASASHSCTTMRRLSAVTGAKPARTWRVGMACATPHTAMTTPAR